MKQFILLNAFVLISIVGLSQECVTQDLDTRSQELIEAIERDLSEATGSTSRSVTYIQTVVHVLWNSQNDNLSDSVVQANIELVNKDLRRHNADTSETPDYFLPVAADTEIELRLAQVDPNGQSTNGITHTYTDSMSFSGFLNHMKYDSTGGVNAWDTEQYLNIWMVRSIGFAPSTAVLGYTTHFDSNVPSEIGIVVRRSQFQSNYGWRTLTHEFGHFACLLHPEAADTCYDADMVSDTPIGQPTFVPNCGDTIVTCNNGPNGNMYMNFMHYYVPSCLNIFTQGQKARMFNCIETQYPGLMSYQFLGVDDVANNQLNLYPNPTDNQLNFQSFENGNLFILELSGRTVLSSLVSKGNNTIDVNSLPSGIYLLRLETEQGVSSARIVKN